jgi:hypothetical protein
MSLLQAPGGGFALAAAGSLGWDAELRVKGHLVISSERSKKNNS